MSLNADELRFAVQDARTKLEKVCGQIADGDKQAQSLLQIYVTLAGAGFSGAAAILSTSSSADLAREASILAQSSKGNSCRSLKAHVRIFSASRPHP